MLKLVETPVIEIMTRPVITVTPNTTAEAIKNIFDTHNIHHLPVVDNQRLVGIISKIDVYRVTHCIDLFKTKENEALNSKLLQSILAEEIMTRHTTVLNPEDSVNYAAEILLKNEFHAIPIVAGEKLMGIVTSFDLIKYAYPKKF